MAARRSSALVLAALSSCRCESGRPYIDAGIEEVEPVPSLSAAPIPTMSAQQSLVEDLRLVEGSWGSPDAGLEAWVRLTSRVVAEASGEPWRLPYPWHLEVADPQRALLYDCGVFNGLEGGSWYTGFCMGPGLVKGRRTPTRVGLYALPKDRLVVELGDFATVIVRR